MFIVPKHSGDRRGRNRMVVGFITTCAMVFNATFKIFQLYHCGQFY
jgi:hypothetical protein